MHREFLAVEVDVYNQLNGIEPVIVSDEVISVTTPYAEFTMCIQHSLCKITQISAAFSS